MHLRSAVGSAMAVLCALASGAVADDGWRELAAQEVDGARVAVEAKAQGGWAFVRVINQSARAVQVHYTLVLACNSTSTPELLHHGRVDISPKRTSDGWASVAECPGLEGLVTSLSMRDVRFLVEGKAVGGAPGDDAECLRALPSLELGLNRKKEVAWIRVRRGKRTVTLSRATLLRLPGPPGPPGKKPTPADDGAAPAEPAFLGLGGTHRGKPAQVWEGALLGRICERTPDAAVLEHRLGTLRKALGDAVEEAATQACLDDETGDACRTIIRKTVGGVRG